MTEIRRHHRRRSPLIWATAGFAALTLVLASCGSDDSAPPAPFGGDSEQDALSSMLDSLPSEFRDAISGEMTGDDGDAESDDWDGDDGDEGSISLGDPPAGDAGAPAAGGKRPGRLAASPVPL